MKVALLTLSLLLISCSSAKRAAIKLTEGGMHEAALEKWAEAYRNDPEDVETLVGFKQCQEKVSNDRLIHIRDLRNSHEEELALKEFQDLIDLQNLHGIRLDYNSSTFQGKEVALLWNYHKAQIESFIRAQRPLAAEHRYQKYFSIFQSHHGIDDLKSSINTSGASQCKVFKGQAGATPFFMEFVKKYCRYFSPGREISSVKMSISDVLYGAPHVDINVKGVEPEVQERMGHSLEKAFTETPWYHPRAKAIPPLTLSGKFEWRRQTFGVERSHSYTVEIPYTDYEDVQREKTITNSDGTKRTESYYESVPVTEYRKETRIHNYAAQKRTLSLEMTLGGKVVIERMGLPFSFSKEETVTRFLHNENLPEIGLYPSTEDVPPPGEKADEYAYKVGNELIGELNELWRKKFCTASQSQSHASMGEQVMRCRRVKEYNQRFVDDWFTNQLGLNYEETEKLIGKF